MSLKGRRRCSLTSVVAPSDLPSEVQQLLREHIRSIETLEILLLLRGDPGRAWTAAAVFQQVRSSERSIGQTLDNLTHRGFLRREPQSDSAFRYAPATDPLRDAIDKLAHLYSERRVRIVEAIYSERISPVDEFARSFRIRKDSNG